jgi:hypothetical protein
MRHAHGDRSLRMAHQSALIADQPQRQPMNQPVRLHLTRILPSVVFIVPLREFRDIGNHNVRQCGIQHISTACKVP